MENCDSNALDTEDGRIYLNQRQTPFCQFTSSDADRAQGTVALKLTGNLRKRGVKSGNRAQITNVLLVPIKSTEF
jgi:hypothetical protein